MNPASTPTIKIVPFNSNYAVTRTSKFVDNIAEVCLGKDILQVKRNGDEYCLLARVLDGSSPTISSVILDTDDRLIGVGIKGSGPLAGLGCEMMAEGWTKAKK